MGNSTSYLPQSQPPPAGKVVIMSNGAVHEFYQPVTVAELMLEHPQHVIVEFESSAKQTRCKQLSPLPADAWLDSKNVYLVVPVRKGKPMALTMSSKEVQRLVRRSGNSSVTMKLKKYCMSLSKAVPYTAATGKMCWAMKKDCVEECLLNTKRHPPIAKDDCLLDEYFRRQMSGRGWKPSLDTILEMNVEKRVSYWLYN